LWSCFLRVRARISWYFGASAGQADARRRDAGAVVTSSSIPSKLGTRPAGLRLPSRAGYCGLLVMIQLRMGAATKCRIILARALSLHARNQRQTPSVKQPPRIIFKAAAFGRNQRPHRRDAELASLGAQRKTVRENLSSRAREFKLHSIGVPHASEMYHRA
jgi:hypothetical protein